MEELLQAVAPAWPYLASGFATLATIAASIHVILHKRDVRAAIAWVGLVWLVPVVGAVLYVLLGINRIRRRGAELRAARHHLGSSAGLRHDGEGLRRHLPADVAHLDTLAGLVDRFARRPLVAGNRVVPLRNGDQAYPEMLAAIAGARSSVGLATYIFDHDRAGARFAEALAAAHRRGVAVRVLIDAAGARYTWPSMVGVLHRRGVPVARFLPARLPWQLSYLNLRNHRKVLVVDGRTGFTGGMNIREGHLVGEGPRHPVEDLHFRLEGPVVTHLAQAFAEDWGFTTGERLAGEAWLPPLAAAGTVTARGITDGPDEDHSKLRFTLLGALSVARRSVRIVTPYFLPDVDLITGLSLAAMRGVAVDIVLPERNNIRLVEWASKALLWQVLQHGCRVHFTAPPFDHSKLMIVDQAWTLIGSANWDPRSLRLNFELSVECYDPALAAELGGIVEGKIAAARLVTMAEVDARGPLLRLRDGTARLLSPYL